MRCFGVKNAQNGLSEWHHKGKKDTKSVKECFFREELEIESSFWVSFCIVRYVVETSCFWFRSVSDPDTPEWTKRRVLFRRSRLWIRWCTQNFEDPTELATESTPIPFTGGQFQNLNIFHIVLVGGTRQYSAAHLTGSPQNKQNPTSLPFQDSWKFEKVEKPCR